LSEKEAKDVKGKTVAKDVKLDYSADRTVISRDQIYGTTPLKEGYNAQPSVQARDQPVASPPKKTIDSEKK